MNDSRTVALVAGAGGIGAALATRLAATGPVTVWSRDSGVDILDETALETAAEALSDDLTHVLVTTGILHHTDHRPERAMRELNRDWMMHSFLVNTIAPALVAKHVLPRLPRDRRAVFAVLGARVGSIADNRTGGWHSYRASKAALVMLVRTLSLEVARTHPLAVCVALHPGTVDTAMSKPFQRGVAAEQLFAPDFAAERLIAVADALTPEDSGGHFAWDGTRIPA